MPRAAEARAWWADVEDVRERIERRRARERREPRSAAGGATTLGRGVREIRPGRRLVLVPSQAPPAQQQRGRRRPRSRAIHSVGSHPDRIAAWAVALGFMLVLAAILSAH